MAQGNFSNGFNSALNRPGLAGLLYGFHLILAVIITVPIYLTIGSTTSITGFSSELAQQFDIALWMDIMEDAAPTFQAMQFQLLWIVPLFLLWKVAASVGIIHTLNSEGMRGFWQGVGEHTGRAVLLALVFLVPLIVLVIGVAILIFVLGLLFSGEVGLFWIYAVLLPTILICGFATLDLMHDYARMELVIRRKPVMESMMTGISWPFRHGGSVAIYVGWFVIAGLALALPTVIDIRPGGFWGVFLLQQVFLFVRAGITVGWFGSEISYYHSVVSTELPLIAADEGNTGLALDATV